MCEKCRGMGRYYRQVFSGACEVKACLCEASANARVVRKVHLEQEHLNNLNRLQEAKKLLKMEVVI